MLKSKNNINDAYNDDENDYLRGNKNIDLKISESNFNPSNSIIKTRGVSLENK